MLYTMEGNPTQFEAIGSRLGFHVIEDTDKKLSLIWRGPRFPAFLCLGIALLLLFVSVPISYAIYLNGFVGAAGSLWYFPLMNLVLFGISFYLLSQKRIIVVDHPAQQVIFMKRSLYQKTLLSLAYTEIKNLRLGVDQVYSGFAVAGSSAEQAFPVPSLRLFAKGDQSILLDRGSLRKLEELGKCVSSRLSKPLEIDPVLRGRIERVTKKESGQSAVQEVAELRPKI